MASLQKSQKANDQKYCNCRNSKCMKLYCQCFAAGQQCNRLCRCTDCHNQKDNQVHKPHKNNGNTVPVKVMGIDGVKPLKGCSCRKSFCIKKYCECFQEGLLCTQNCKCIECQNNQSMTNRNVLIKLRKTPSATSGGLCALYPIILSQNAEHIQSILNEENTLNLDDKEIQSDVGRMGLIANEGNMQPLVANFIDVLKKIQAKVSKVQAFTPVKEEEKELKEQKEQNL